MGGLGIADFLEQLTGMSYWTLLLTDWVGCVVLGLVFAMISDVGGLL